MVFQALPDIRVGGLDVGQLTDHTVLATLQPEDGRWVVDGVYQLPLQVPYSRQLRLLQPHLDLLTHLAIDAGGSGQGLPEHISGNRLKHLVPVVITGGGGKGRVVKGRVTVGKTDDYSYNIVENPVDVHDLHATLLHLLGLDHRRLTFRSEGRDHRLTDVFGKVRPELLA